MSGRRAMVVEFVVVLVGCLIVVAALAAAGMRPKAVWFVAAAVVAAVVVAGIRVLVATVARTEWTEPLALVRSRGFNSDTRVRMLGSQLRQATKDPHAFRRLAQPALVAIVAARLQRRYGVDLTYYPGEARSLTGEWLWDLITTTEPRTPTAEEIARAVEAVENL